MRRVTIGERVIDDEGPAYVIAEIGNNHGGSVGRAADLVEMAADAGADAVKFQVRTIDRLFTAEELARPYDHPHSYGATYGAHRAALELSQNDLRRVWDLAASRGLDCFATPFDPWAADRIMALGVPCMKIASGDLTNVPLLTHVASFGVPIILSTGGASKRDIDRGLACVLESALLHCTSVYPAPPDLLNLRAIDTLRSWHPELVVGYSGHDTGVQASILAYWSGARIIEKHVTLDRAGKGTDHAMSLEPQGVRKLVEDLRKARASRGDGIIRPIPEETVGLSKWAAWREAHRDLVG